MLCAGRVCLCVVFAHTAIQSHKIMSSAEKLIKIPMILGMLWAHHVTFSPPTSFVPRDPNAKGDVSAMPEAVRVIRKPLHRKISRGVIRTVVLCEILVILAAQFPSPLSTYILTVLDRGTPTGSGAGRVRITSIFTLGWILTVVGGLIRRACYRAMGKHFTFEITVREDHRLITHGPYSIVRHPSYSALVLVVVGRLLCSFGAGSWMKECGILDGWMGQAFGVLWAIDELYVPAMMIFFRVKKEDELLRKEFGREWEAWVQRTPYALIPGIY
ncbi:hypothetical protein BD414DRAFT_494310 [Trametes punicea]|nr:hypothetical protein BD414DRAFT_494310 [Trametes punicea]